ncbi:MAG: hypothetical protein JXR36_16815 [Bacteroidales bacterium]|nr:hypothetical protein [Bacteroidales bacterium]
MRKILFLTSIILAIFLSSCKDEIKLPEDQIFYSEINKTVTVSSIDSIDGCCKYLTFKIDTNNVTDKQVFIFKRLDPLLDCDGYSQLAASRTNMLDVINKDESISESNSWNGDTVYLDDFAGKGEKFIGYRAIAYGSSTAHYYGWIKLELSADKSLLKIISRADNLTADNPIKAGQVE